MPESIELGARESEELLRSGIAGRVALVTPTGPHIVPVNYSVVDDAVIIRTSPYSLLGTYGRDTTLAFQIDGFDQERSRGWSVQVRGRGQVVTDQAQIDRIREVGEPRPWANGVRSLYLRLRWTEMSGRQLGTHWDPVHERPAATGN
jgi:nitroimidazol reductase NimA-like FMN-containing flavoprotein (pyridoxamine 5'-phosphate oxidase superfamily)